jgi:hypothetical protein
MHPIFRNQRRTIVSSHDARDASPLGSDFGGGLIRVEGCAHRIRMRLGDWLTQRWLLQPKMGIYVSRWRGLDSAGQYLGTPPPLLSGVAALFFFFLRNSSSERTTIALGSPWTSR